MAAAFVGAGVTTLRSSMMQLQLTELPDGAQSSMLSKITCAASCMDFIARLARQCSYNTMPNAECVKMYGLNDMAWHVLIVRRYCNTDRSSGSCHHKHAYIMLQQLVSKYVTALQEGPDMAVASCGLYLLLSTRCVRSNMAQCASMHQQGSLPAGQAGQQGW